MQRMELENMEVSGDEPESDMDEEEEEGKEENAENAENEVAKE
jgi:hypothetical protein